MANKQKKVKYIDLGLPSGTKWATCNVGANKPEEHGDYFAWAETATKSEYSCDTYEYNSNDNFTKYCTDSEFGIVDNKTQLEASDDAATANWGAAWCTPTIDQWSELVEKCTWTWTAVNEINGYRVTSNTTGNSIFLPAAGYRNNDDLNNAGNNGNYWSSSLYEGYPDWAWGVDFCLHGVGHDGNGRHVGQPIRPVRKQPSSTPKPNPEPTTSESKYKITSEFVPDGESGTYQLEDMSVTYSQPADTCDNPEKYQHLTIKTENTGLGTYYVLNTERWAFDSLEELEFLIKDFIKRLEK